MSTKKKSLKDTLLSLKDKLKILIAIPGMNGNMGIPTLIWGLPGAGKTAILNQLGTEMGLRVETVILSIRDPSDVAGLPVIRPEGVVHEAPIWAKNIMKGDGGIVFLDELNTAPPSTQAAGLRVINDRVVGDCILPANARMIAATNPIDSSAGGWELAPPLANRFCHINYKGPSVDEWTNWLLSGSKTTNELIPNKFEGKDWDNAFAKAKGLVASFLRRNPVHLGPTIPEASEKQSRGWPSPRSWEMATRIFAACSLLEVDYSEMLEGTIGEGVTKEFCSWAYYNDLPNPSDLIDGSASFVPDPTRVDKTQVVTMSLASYAISYPTHAPRVWKLIKNYTIKAQDLGVHAIRALVDAKLYHSDEAMETLGSLDNTLAAGFRIKFS